IQPPCSCQGIALLLNHAVELLSPAGADTVFTWLQVQFRGRQTGKSGFAIGGAKALLAELTSAPLNVIASLAKVLDTGIVRAVLSYHLADGCGVSKGDLGSLFR